MKDQPKALILANSMHLAYRVGWQREVAAELRRLPEIEAQRDEARRTAREAHEIGTRVVAQRDALLEALKRMASIIDTMGDMPGGFIHPSPWQTLKYEKALTQARAAIAAVEGENHAKNL